MTRDLEVLLACTHEAIDRQLHSLTAIDVALTAATRQLGADRAPAELATLLESIQVEVSRTRLTATQLERDLRATTAAAATRR